MRRILYALGLAVGIVGIALLIAFWNFLQHWSAVHTGTISVLCGSSPCVNQPYYGFWSGFGSDLGEATMVVSLVTLATHHARMANCEVKGCWRLGRHSTAAGHRACRKHHPEGHLSEADLHRAHHAAK